MDIEMKGRLHALEWFLTQLISEDLMTVADPAARVRLAKDRLDHFADTIAIETGNLDEQARLRLATKEAAGKILYAALERAIGEQAG
ncbi:MAG: hypothetical protein ACLQJR_05435 [Stellaceae bacterium]